MINLTRRGFFGLLAGAAAGVAISDELADMLSPRKTIILPPAGVWIPKGNQLLTVSMITAEALRILEKDMAFAYSINRQYDQYSGPGELSVVVRKPAMYRGLLG